MSRKAFEGTVAALGLFYAFGIFVPFVFLSIMEGRIGDAVPDAFANRHAAGWSLDVLLSGAVIMVWIVYERAKFGIKNGWIAWPLMFVPGVATALAYYLVIRSLHFARTKQHEHSDESGVGETG